MLLAVLGGAAAAAPVEPDPPPSAVGGEPWLLAPREIDAGTPRAADVTHVPGDEVLRTPTSLRVTTYGSSSCPALVDRWRPDGPRRLVVTVDVAPARACTADLGPTVSWVTLPVELRDVPGLEVVLVRPSPGVDERDSVGSVHVLR